MTVKANVIPFWATPIADYVNAELAQELKEYVLTQDAQGIESGVAEFVKHNLIESKFNFFHSNEPVIQKTIQWICECLKATLNAIHGSEENYQIGFNETWYHITKTNGMHGVHKHPNCSWCGVFYLDPGEGEDGKTSFITPVDSSYHDHGNRFLMDTSLDINPKEGLLVLFPSYLAHTQKLYTGEKDRIVVAFNMTVHEAPANAQT
tara:strand:+ start:647 stop:1264 length:618 start_codon:yes stop_codon:yes gene_type:complete